MSRRLTAVVIAAALVCGASAALASSQVSVVRCGYSKITFGKVGVYPWHVSCAAAKRVVRGSDARHAKTIVFTADGAETGDSEAVRINGAWWVCGGRMGTYFCGYPYRPARVGGVGGGTTSKGPFTKDIAFDTCSGGGGCPAKDTVYLPGAAAG